NRATDAFAQSRAKHQWRSPLTQGDNRRRFSNGKIFPITSDHSGSLPCDCRATAPVAKRAAGRRSACPTILCFAAFYAHACKARLNLLPLATRTRLIAQDRYNMTSLDKETKLRLLTIILESRHADLREQNLNRQGKGHFHVGGMGHEALAAVSIQMESDDYIV